MRLVSFPNLLRSAMRNCLLPTAYCPLPTAHCLLPTAHCPLPTAHCPLPTAHCLLPSSSPPTARHSRARTQSAGSRLFIQLPANDSSRVANDPGVGRLREGSAVRGDLSAACGWEGLFNSCR